MPRGLTVEEMFEELENYEVTENEFVDIELAIIPPDPDELTDEENIEENTLTNDNIVQDVAGTLELITGRDEDNCHDEPPETKRKKVLEHDVESAKNRKKNSKKTGSTQKRRGTQGNRLMAGRISTDVRLDPGNHFIVPTTTQKRCAYCKKNN
ncbi:hypothetical protein C0J52_24661 [Blattella germanica]|nr:hypothetical protein C0J52_24661 [Blattella germanica]